MTSTYVKIRRRIRDLVAFILFITAITLGLSIYWDYQQKTGLLFKESQSQVRIIAEHASRTFGEVENALDIAVNKVLKPEKLNHLNEKELYSAFLSAHVGTPQISSLYFVDNKGTLLASSLKYPINKIDLSDREYFRHHIDTSGHAPFISKPYKNRITNKWNVVFSQRINNPDGSFAGVAGASIEMAYYESLYAELVGGTSGKISLVREDGSPIVMFPSEDKRFSRPIKISNQILHSQKCVYREKDNDPAGSEQVVAYCRLPANYQLVAHISYDWNKSIAVWRRDALVKIVLAVLFGSLAVALTRMLMRRLYELERSEEQRSLLSLIVDQNPVSIIVTDPDANITYVNPSFCNLTGYSAEEAMGRNPSILKSGLNPPETFPEMWTKLAAGQQWSGELCNKKKDGSLYWEMAHLFPILDSTGTITHLAGVKENITNRKRAEEALTSSLSLLNATLESTVDGILVVDLNGHVVRWNQKFVDLWQVPEEVLNSDVRYRVTDHIVSQMQQPEEFLARVMQLYNTPEESSVDTLYLADGRIFKRFSQPQRIGDNVVGRVWSFDDITERRHAKEALEESNRKLEVLCITDGLTGIANRRRFDEILIMEHARHVRSGGELSLIMLDIDHFKEFNDSYGHVKGDECLAQIAQVIADCINRPTDLAARYGGEEFACILPETDRSGTVVIAEKIRRGIMALSIPHMQSSVADCVTVSLGVASVQCTKGGSVVNIVAQADEMLYRAKSRGRNRVEFVAAPGVAMTSAGEIKSNPMQLTWKDYFCCGNQLIDSQHQSLFHLANKLLEATLPNRPPDEIPAIIVQLLDDVSNHFHDEEKILESVGFTGLSQHMAEHAKLLAKGRELTQNFNASTFSVGEVFQFLVNDVLIVHMLGADTEFFPFTRDAAEDAQRVENTSSSGPTR